MNGEGKRKREKGGKAGWRERGIEGEKERERGEEEKVEEL